VGLCIGGFHLFCCFVVLLLWDVMLCYVMFMFMFMLCYVDICLFVVYVKFNVVVFVLCFCVLVLLLHFSFSGKEKIFCRQMKMSTNGGGTGKRALNNFPYSSSLY